MRANLKARYVGKCCHTLSFLLILVLSVTTSPVVHTTTPMTTITTDKLEVDIRLPRSLIPSHYDVRLLPIIEKENFSFFGDITITLRCDEDTYKIVMHAVDLVVDEASIVVR